MSQRRVVVTGIGTVTPVGNDLASTWEGLVSGKSGIARVTAFDTTAYDVKIAGEVKNFDAKPYFAKSPKDARRMDRYTQFAMAAAQMAMKDGGVDPNTLNLERAGVLVGSGIGGLLTLEEQHTVLMQKGPGRLSPFLIPTLISNIASGLISMEFGFAGPNFAVVTACATSAMAVGEAWRLIRDDEAEIILAGGSEATICPMGLGGFAAMRALSTRNDEPEKASRPFDKDRDGFVSGEGAGVLVVEEYEHARKRGARIYAELVGYGLTADAYHMSAPLPDGAGAGRAMANALKRAGLNASQVGYINAHGTSTPIGDVCETVAIKRVFGEAAKTVQVSSSKSMTGHMLGAAGAVEMAVCCKVLETGIIPPTLNLDHPDEQCDLDYVPHTARESKVTAVMNNSFGFGGHNSSLVAVKL